MMWDPYGVVDRLKADPDVALMGFRLHASVSDATLNAHCSDERDGGTNPLTAYPKRRDFVDIYDRRDSRQVDKVGMDGRPRIGALIHEEIPAAEAEALIRRILLQTVPEGRPRGAQVMAAVARALPADTAAWLRAHQDQLLDTFDDVAGAIYRAQIRKERQEAVWTPAQLIAAAKMQNGGKEPLTFGETLATAVRGLGGRTTSEVRGAVLRDLHRIAENVGRYDSTGMVFARVDFPESRWNTLPKDTVGAQEAKAFARHYGKAHEALRDFWLQWLTSTVDTTDPAHYQDNLNYARDAYAAINEEGRRLLTIERAAAAIAAKEKIASVLGRIRSARALLVFAEPLPWAKGLAALPATDIWLDIGFPTERWTASLVQRDLVCAMRREPGPDVADVYFTKASKVKATGGDLLKLPDAGAGYPVEGRIPPADAGGFLTLAVDLYESLVHGVRLRGEVFAWSAHFCAPLSKIMERRTLTWAYIDDVKRIPGKLREHFFAAGFPQILVSTDGNQMLLAGLSDSDTSGMATEGLRIVGATAAAPEALYPSAPKGRKGRDVMGRGEPTAYGRVIPTVASGGRLLPHHEVLASNMGSASPSLAMQAIDTLGDYPEWPAIIPDAATRGDFRELDVEAMLRSLREVAPDEWGTDVLGHAPEWVKTRKAWSPGYRTPRIAFQSDGSIRFVPAGGPYEYAPADKKGEDLTESGLARRASKTLARIEPGARAVFQAGVFLDTLAVLAANGSYRCEISVPKVEAKPTIVQNIGGRRPVMMFVMGLVVGADK